MKHRVPHRRRAATLLEALVGIVLVTAAVGLAAQIVAITTTQLRIAEQRELATQEAANLMERICAQPWAELDQNYVDSIALPPACRQRLPEAELQVQVEREEPEDAPAAKRLSVEIGWQTRRDAARRTVQLTAWKFAGGENAP